MAALWICFNAHAQQHEALPKTIDDIVVQLKAIGNTDIAIKVNPRSQVFGAQEFLVARREELEAELAYVLISQGRLQEAEWHARTALQRTLKRLRQSMLALMDDNAVDAATGRPLFSYAHPIFWASYALVGDPGH